MQRAGNGWGWALHIHALLEGVCNALVLHSLLKEGGNSSSCWCFVLDLIFFLVVAAELIYWLLPGSEELTLHP